MDFEIRCPVKRRSVLRSLALLPLLAFPAGAKAGQDAPRRWALIVGVGDYLRTLKQPPPSRPVNLLGPKNDAEAIRELLQGRYGFARERVRVLKDAHGTRAGILAGWEWLIASARPGDQVVFYFSGHGTVVEQANGRKRSALCPYDFLVPASPIIGPEIGERIDRLKTSEVVVIVDACHAESGSRSLFRVKYADPKVFALSKPAKSAASGGPPAPPVFSTRDGAASAAKFPERYLGAARLTQEALDLPLLDTAPRGDGNRHMGVMTYHLLQELKDTSRELSYRELADRLRLRIEQTAVSFKKAAHEPAISGPDLSAAFLDLPRAAATPDTPPVSVIARVESVSGNNVTARLTVGAAARVGSILAGTSTKDWVEASTGQGGGVVRITSVDANKVQGLVTGGSVFVGETLRESFQAVGGSGKLRVAFTADTDTSRRLKQAIQLDFIEHIPLAKAGVSADYLILEVSKSAPGTLIPTWRGIVLPEVKEADLPRLLRRCHIQKPLLDLRGGVGGPLLSVRCQGMTGYTTALIDSRVEYEVRADRDIYFTLLSLNADGTVTGLTDRPLAARQVWTGGQIQITPPVGLDIVQVIAAPFPLNAAIPRSLADAREKDQAPAIRALLQSLSGQINQTEIQREAQRDRERGQDFSATVESVAASPDIPSTPIAARGWSVAEIFVRILK